MLPRDGRNREGAVQTSGAKACRKMSVLMGIALAITGSFAAILTLHV
jgi:hypothetical protein